MMVGVVCVCIFGPDLNDSMGTPWGDFNFHPFFTLLGGH